jgi:hypothetical protein
MCALGGSSYAALEIDGHDVRNSSLTGADIKNGTLRSGDVKNGSLRELDFKEGQLPAGPPGETGPRGATGPSGATKVTLWAKAYTALPHSFVANVATCPAGQRATGGGGYWDNAPDTADQPIIETKASKGIGYPVVSGETPRAWFVRAFNDTNAQHKLIVEVVCAAP